MSYRLKAWGFLAAAIGAHTAGLYEIAIILNIVAIGYFLIVLGDRS
jgi:hypothetical protein